MGSAPALLEVEAVLSIAGPWERTVTIQAGNGRGRVDLPRAALSLRSLRMRPPPAVRRQWAGALGQALARAGLRVDVTCAGHVIARASPGGRGNWAGRIAGLAPMELRVSGLLGALLARSR